MSSFDALSARDPELLKLRLAVRDFVRSDRAEFGWHGTTNHFARRLGRLALEAEHPWDLITG